MSPVSRTEHGMNALQLSPPEPNSSTSNGDQPPASRTRPWNIVAEEVSHEQDPTKLTKLVAELNQALDEQGIGKPSSTAG